MNFQAPGGGPEGFKWHLKSCSLLLVSGVLLARARGSKIDPILIEMEAKSLPGAVQMASKAVFNTAAISVLISTLGGMKMRDEHGMLREVYISCHDFCHTFRWYENEGRAWNA